MKFRLLPGLLIFFILNSCSLGVFSSQFEIDGTDIGTLTFNTKNTAGNKSTVNSTIQVGHQTSEYNKLINKAEEALKSPLFSVTNKPMVPPNGSKHDYISLARYAWPNPDTKDGLPYILKDGKANPEVKEFDKVRLSKMTKNAFELGLAYHFTKNSKYASKAASLIKTWFFKEETYMAPNFKFAQFIPGVREGGSSGLIESRDFIKVIETVSLIYNSSYWTREDQLKLKKWFQNFLEWMLSSSIGNGERNRLNNHGTWYDAQVAVYATFIGKKELAESALHRTFTKRIYEQITQEGKQPLELSRNLSQHYTLFNLNALLINLFIYQNLNDNFAPPVRVKKALLWLMPYASKERKWNYKQINDFSECRYLELFLKSYSIYGAKEFKLVSEQLINSGCSSQALLLYPVN